MPKSTSTANDEMLDDILVTRLCYAVSDLVLLYRDQGLTQLHKIKAQIEDRFISKPSSTFWQHGGPPQRRFEEALVALRQRKPKLTKSQIQQIFDAAFNSETAAMEQ